MYVIQIILITKSLISSSLNPHCPPWVNGFLNLEGSTSLQDVSLNGQMNSFILLNYAPILVMLLMISSKQIISPPKFY